MTARAGMATLIALVRAAANAGTADYSIAGTTYWSDDQIQAELDRTQRLYQFVEMDFAPLYVDGVWEYKDYLLPDALGTYLEQGHSADSGWVIRDSHGGSVDSTTYTVDYEAGRISFAADRRGSVMFVDARAYNMNRAAAYLWRKKASHTKNVDWKSDNTEVKKSGEYTQALEMARYYDSLAGPVVSQFYRTDEL
jgi:hypothetical protein